MTTLSAALEGSVPDAWQAAWSAVPKAWRGGVYRLDRSPGNEVFVRNTMYLRSKRTYDFRPEVSERMGNELAWWVWTVWSEGTRKIEPSMLRWWQRAIDALATSSTQPAQPLSITGFDPGSVVREALRQFQQRHGRLPSPGSIRNLEAVAHGIHDLLLARCAEGPWWMADRWSLALDTRIPRREHEPNADRIVNIGRVEPPWLREGLRFWLSRSLISGRLVWTTLASRLHQVDHLFGRFCRTHGIENPVIAEGADLRATFVEYLSFLRSPSATTKGRPLRLPASFTPSQRSKGSTSSCTTMPTKRPR